MKFSPQSSALALFGALAAAGYSGSAFAVPSVPNNCPGVPEGFQTSQVLDAVEGAGPTFDYGFRVCNTSFFDQEQGDLIRDWELPFFGSGSGQNIVENLSNITNIETPEGWTWSIEAIDGVGNAATGWEGVADWQTPGNDMKDFFDAFFGGEANNPYNTVTHVLHFYTDCGEFGDPCIFPGGSLEGFGFTAGFDSTNAPYQASWDDFTIRTGDPQFPLGVQPTNPIIARALANIPEPGTLAMLGLGLGAMAAARRRREEEDAS